MAQSDVLVSRQLVATGERHLTDAAATDERFYCGALTPNGGGYTVVKPVTGERIGHYDPSKRVDKLLITTNSAKRRHLVVASTAPSPALGGAPAACLDVYQLGGAGSNVLEGHRHRFSVVALHQCPFREDRFVCVSGDGEVSIWDCYTWTLISTFNVVPLVGNPTCAIFTSDRHVAIGGERIAIIDYSGIRPGETRVPSACVRLLEGKHGSGPFALSEFEVTTCLCVFDPHSAQPALPYSGSQVAILDTEGHFLVAAGTKYLSMYELQRQSRPIHRVALPAPARSLLPLGVNRNTPYTVAVGSTEGRMFLFKKLTWTHPVMISGATSGHDSASVIKLISQGPQRFASCGDNGTIRMWWLGWGASSNSTGSEAAQWVSAPLLAASSSGGNITSSTSGSVSSPPHLSASAAAAAAASAAAAGMGGMMMSAASPPMSIGASPPTFVPAAAPAMTPPARQPAPPPSPQQQQQQRGPSTPPDSIENTLSSVLGMLGVGIDLATGGARRTPTDASNALNIASALFGAVDAGARVFERHGPPAYSPPAYPPPAAMFHASPNVVAIPLQRQPQPSGPNLSPAPLQISAPAPVNNSYGGPASISPVRVPAPVPSPAPTPLSGVQREHEDDNDNRDPTPLPAGTERSPEELQAMFDALARGQDPDVAAIDGPVSAAVYAPGAGNARVGSGFADDEPQTEGASDPVPGQRAANQPRFGSASSVDAPRAAMSAGTLAAIGAGPSPGAAVVLIPWQSSSTTTNGSSASTSSASPASSFAAGAGTSSSNGRMQAEDELRGHGYGSSASGSGSGSQQSIADTGGTDSHPSASGGYPPSSSSAAAASGAVSPSAHSSSTSSDDSDFTKKHAEPLLPQQPRTPRNGIKRGLCVGISNYPNGQELPFCVNDAFRMHSLLGGLDFHHSVFVRDPTSNELYREVTEFIESVQEGDTVLIYFASHGIQADNDNWILPIDFTPGRRERNDTYFDMGALPIHRYIISRLQARRPWMSILLLDCCRDNPNIQAAEFNPRARGLAARAPPGGIVIGFACAQDRNVRDFDPADPHGRFGDGLYTTALCRFLPMRAHIIEVLQTVATQVSEYANRIAVLAADGGQVPWTHFGPLPPHACWWSGE